MIWTPHLTVAAVCRRDGKFLMVEEMIDGERVINQPAGHVDEGEGIIDAVIRETREETAWGFIPKYVIGIYQLHITSRNHTYFRFAFYGDCHDFDPNQALDEEIECTHWMSREELLGGSVKLRSPLVTQCLDDFTAGKSFPLDLFSDAP